MTLIALTVLGIDMLLKEKIGFAYWVAHKNRRIQLHLMVRPGLWEKNYRYIIP